MSLDIRDEDVITFGDCKVDADSVLDPKKKFKLCIRFDGAAEIVEVTDDYWFTNTKFHWHPKQKFNVKFNCHKANRSPETSDDDYDYDDFGFVRYKELDDGVVLFIGDRSMLRSSKV